MKEIWKTMIYNNTEYTNYLVSTFGRIKNRTTGNVLKCQIHSTGYYNINIKPNGKKDNGIVIRLHRAIAQTFIDNIDNKNVVNHKDGNKLNNNINNLEWCTSQENSNHAKLNNLIKKGVEASSAKLSEADILYIRENYIPFDKIFGRIAMANRFKVNVSTISRVISK